MKKFLLSSLLVTVATVSAYATDIYIIGANVDGQNWALGTNKMTDNGDGTYTWKGSKLGSEFKFNDGSWSGSYNIGSNGNKISLGQAYIGNNNGNSGNIAFTDASLIVDNPTVTIDLESLSIMVTGNETQGEKNFTIAGSFNDNNGNDPKYALSETNGLYSGTFNIPGGSTFQVVLNGAIWYGYKNPVESDITLTESSPTVTVETSTGYQNDFLFLNSEAADLTFIFDYESMHLTVSLDSKVEAPTGPDLYLIGDNVNGESWGLQTNKMTNKGNGIYTWSGSVLGTGFKVNDGTWDNPDYNIGGDGSQMKIGQPFTISSGNDCVDIIFADNIGRVENASVTLNLSEKTIIVTGTPVEVQPESGFFIIGEVEGYGWDPSKGYPMSEISTGVYQAKNVVMTGSYFAFASELGNWTIVNAHRYSPAQKDAPFIIGELNDMVYGVDSSWNIEMGTYDFTVDTGSMTAIAVNSSDGVTMIESDIKGEDVIYNLQGIRVNRDKTSPGLYIVNGKKIILK